MNIWIAEKVLTEVPLATLEGQGYLSGTEVQIDGNVYLCRLIMDFPRTRTANEMDQIVAALGEEANILFDDYPFWVKFDEEPNFGRLITELMPEVKCRRAPDLHRYGFRPVFQLLPGKKPVCQGKDPKPTSLGCSKHHVIKVMLREKFIG